MEGGNDMARRRIQQVSWLLPLAGLLCASIPAFSQSADMNYVLTRTMRSAGGTVYTDDIQYYDGLGRPRLAGMVARAFPFRRRIQGGLRRQCHNGAWRRLPVRRNHLRAVALGPSYEADRPRRTLAHGRHGHFHPLHYQFPIGQLCREVVFRRPPHHGQGDVPHRPAPLHGNHGRERQRHLFIHRQVGAHGAGPPDERGGSPRHVLRLRHGRPPAARASADGGRGRVLGQPQPLRLPLRI